MNKSNTAAQLIQARKNLQWTQTILAQHTGIRRARLSQFENAHRRPSQAEWRKLREVLNLPYFLSSEPIQLPLADRSWSALKPTLDDGGRPVRACLFAARRRFGFTAVNTALAQINARSDRAACHQFLERARPEAVHECLFWLKLLAAGANPCRLSPLRAGYRQHNVVHPVSKDAIGDLKLACLEWHSTSYRCLLFPQVTIDARRAHVRLHALACVRAPRDQRWLRLEIDGQGHDPRVDLERQDLLDLATLRLNTQELAASDLALVVERKFAPLLGLRMSA